MSGQSPKFNESDPGWIRLDVLRALLGIKHAQMQRIRKQLGNAFEHASKKPGQPTWVYAPEWLRAWSKLESPAAAAGADPSQLTGKKKQEFYDGEIAEANYRARKGELVEAKDVAVVFNEIAGEMSHALTMAQRISPDAAERMLAALDKAELKLQRFNGHAGSNGTIDPTRFGPRTHRKSKA